MAICLSPNGGTVHRGDSPSHRLLVATIDGVAIVDERSPGDWAGSGRSPQGVHVGSLLLEPVRGGIFAGAHSGGLFRSLDGGATWERRVLGLADPHVFTLATVQRDGQVVLYAGTEPAHLYESTDYGETWNELAALRSIPYMEHWTFPEPPHIAHVKNIAFHPHDSRTMLIGVEQGALLKSVDAGRSWIEIVSYERPEHVAYRDVHRIVFSPSRPDTIFMVNGNGLLRTDDGGQTWEQLTNRKSRIGYPDGLVLSPDERLLFLSGAERNPGTWHENHSANAGVARSADGGRTWELLDEGLPKPLRGNVEALSVESWPGGYRLFIGTTEGDVFVRAEKDNTWSQIASGLPPVSKVGHYRDMEVRLAR